jgi:Mg-chelatase subunit ChlD
MTTNGSKRDKWVSASLITGAVLAGLAAVAAQRRGVAAVPLVPAPVTAAPAVAAPAPPPLAPTAPGPIEPAPAAQAARPKVDLVFALDTTGSMSGLIEGAKTKIWSIASFVARAQPTPDVRVGLVAYRDIGDAYVTRVFDLDSDLDRVYRRLLSFRADGGGDTPEHVARALDEAVHKMSWGASGANAVRLIYLVGDAPPHLDYQDGYDYAKAARDAANKGIQVHAIRCGNDPDTATYWRKIASLGHGEFLTIDQSGGMHDTRTPYDAELARLHDELDGTVVAYGAKGGAARAAIAAAAAAPVSVKAARAGFLSAKKDASETFADDLVGSVAAGSVDLDKVAPGDMPESLAALPAAKRKEEIAKKATERKELLERISKASTARDAYLRESPEKPTGFDGEVRRTVEKAGSAAGLKF